MQEQNDYRKISYKIIVFVFHIISFFALSYQSKYIVSDSWVPKQKPKWTVGQGSSTCFSISLFFPPTNKGFDDPIFYMSLNPIQHNVFFKHESTSYLFYCPKKVLGYVNKKSKGMDAQFQPKWGQMSKYLFCGAIWPHPVLNSVKLNMLNL